jgi:hypothetical protein
MSRVEDEANEDNVNFLRSTAITSDGEDDHHAPTSTQQARRLRQMDNLISEQRRIQSERESARRLRRAVLRSGMSTSGSAESGQRNEAEALMMYGATSPTRGPRRSLGYQGWAPGTMDHEVEEGDLTFNELRALARGHTRPIHDTATRRHIREEELALPGSHWSSRPGSGAEEMDWQTSRLMNEAYPSSTADPSLRTTALLQSVRRHARFSPSHPYQVSNSSDIDRLASQAAHDERARTVDAELARVLRAHNRVESQPRETSNELHRVRAREDICAHHHTPTFLEEAIKYLEALRQCDNDSDRMSLAKEGSFLVIDDDMPVPDPNDFIIDATHITAPQPTSWLRAGAVFSGSQRSESSTMFPSIQLSHHQTRRSHNRPQTAATINTQARTLPPLQRSSNAQVSHGSGNRAWLRTAPQPAQDDTWPVKVTITSIDHNKMTLTGTMEAFNVPHKNAPHAESTIATYLEGEIIDFNRFTLKTTSFEVEYDGIDSAYWKELEPFKGLGDATLAKSVVSRRWLAEELGEKYVLMRWKGKQASRIPAQRSRRSRVATTWTRARSRSCGLRSGGHLVLTASIREMLHHAQRRPGASDHLWLLLHLAAARGWPARGTVLRQALEPVPASAAAAGESGLSLVQVQVRLEK